jgi:PleD family two-component response regulator
MSVRLCERALREVAAGLASLSKPTPDKVEQIGNGFRALRLEATGQDKDELSASASDVEECARAISLQKANAHSACVQALYRAGYAALLKLSKYAESPETMEETRFSLSRNVLVVDDSRVAAVALSNALAAKEFLVRSVATMEEALSEFRSFSPTVLVSDVHMPNLDVAVLCRTFRELSQGRPILTVLVSATTGPELEARLEQVKPDAFVAKMTGTGPVITKIVALWDALNARTFG